LPTPVITATAINNGYSIAYTTPSRDLYPEYDHIEIEEVQSNASTDPGTGYSSSFIGTANPAVVIVSSLNKRWVRARFWDNAGLASPYSTAVSTTPTTPITIDTTPPAAPSSGSVSAGIDTSSGSTVGFNAYLDISWTAVSDATLKGYRIRFRKNGSSDPYGYVDSPGTGTSYRLNGLSIGVTYEVAIASYDEFNNTTGTYTSLGTASAGGTPYIGKNVSTTGYFEAAPSGETGAFRFGYGVESGKRGLTFNTNNYWYIDSSASATFKLGGSTANYISWDGFNFIVDGNIRAKGGYFAGQLEMQSGAGIYSGTVVSNTLTSDGFLLNTNGLIIKKGSISLRLDASDGGIYAQKGTIGDWTISTTAIVSSSGNVPKITLNSSTQQIVASSNTYSAGIAIPEADSGSAIVFWAGQSGRTTSSKFYVTANGTLYASGATISGSLTSTAGSIGGWTIGSTTITGGATTLNSNGNITITSGTKTTTIKNDATLSLVDSSTGFLTGGGISIQSGSEFASIGATGISLGTASFFANKLGLSYPTDALVIATTGPEIHIGGAGATAPIYFNFRVNNLLNSISTGAYTTDETSTSAGTFIGPSGVIHARRSAATPMFSHRTDGNGRVITFYLGGTAGGGINATAGGTPTFAAASDYRLKENIVDYNNATDRIKAARLRKFNLKSIPEKEFVGFIAHEFAEVDPDFVIGEKDAIDEDGNPIYQEIGTTNLVYYLTGALKESIIKIEELEQRLDALEG